MACRSTSIPSSSRHRRNARQCSSRYCLSRNAGLWKHSTEDDPNFIDDYLFLSDQSRRDIVTKLEEIKGIIERGDLRNVEFQGLAAIMFGQHLHHPLVYVNSDVIEVKPVPLNEGKRDFVLNLQQHCSYNKPFFRGKELHLL